MRRPNITSMRIAAVVLAAAVALTLGACGGAKTKTVTVSVSNANPTTTAATSAEPTAAARASATTTAAPTPALCRAGGLSLIYLGQQGATGHGIVGVMLRNTGRSSCHTFGYPGVLWLTKTGAALPTTSVRTTHDFFGPAPLTSLTVAPGGTFSFRLGVTHGAAGTAGCATAYGLQVIPPDDTHTLRLTIPNGAFQCRTTTISPVRPGSSAYHP